jgi:excisionase family DNA binding protein
MTVSQVAKQLGVCAATVYKLCASGALAHVRVMNAIRVSIESLQAFTSSPSSEISADPLLKQPRHDSSHHPLDLLGGGATKRPMSTSGRSLPLAPRVAPGRRNLPLAPEAGCLLGLGVIHSLRRRASQVLRTINGIAP